MSIFVVALRQENAEVEKRIVDHYRSYKMSPTCILVASEDLSEEVATRIGIKGQARIETALGAVFRLNGAYSGFTKKSLWEWINKVESG